MPMEEGWLDQVARSGNASIWWKLKPNVQSTDAMRLQFHLNYFSPHMGKGELSPERRGGLAVPNCGNGF